MLAAWRPSSPLVLFDDVELEYPRLAVDWDSTRKTSGVVWGSRAARIAASSRVGGRGRRVESIVCSTPLVSRAQYKSKQTEKCG